MVKYAVIDTNVLVSSLLAKHSDSATVLVMGKVFVGEIIPIFSAEIMEEYKEVLARDKFKFNSERINSLLFSMQKFGLLVEPSEIKESLPDPDDMVFYEAVMEVRKVDDAYLVTGNLKHFPDEPFIVSPSEMITLLDSD